MSKPALVSFLESIQRVEDEWAAYAGDLNSYTAAVEKATAKAEASIALVLNAARQAVEDLTELSSLQPPEVS